MAFDSTSWIEGSQLGLINNSNSGSTLVSTPATPTTIVCSDNAPVLKFVEKHLVESTSSDSIQNPHHGYHHHHGKDKEPDLEPQRELGLFGLERKNCEKEVVVQHETNLHTPDIETSTLTVAMTRAGKYHPGAQARDRSDRDPVHDLGTTQRDQESGAKTKAKAKKTAKARPETQAIAEAQQKSSTPYSTTLPTKLTKRLPKSTPLPKESLDSPSVASTSPALTSAVVPRRAWLQSTYKSSARSKPPNKLVLKHQISSASPLLSLSSYSSPSSSPTTTTTTITFQPSSPSLFSSYCSPTFASATFSHYNKNKRNKRLKKRSQSHSTIPRRPSLVPQVPPLPPAVLALTAASPVSACKIESPDDDDCSVHHLPTALTAVSLPSSPVLESLARSSPTSPHSDEDPAIGEKGFILSLEADLVLARALAPVLDSGSCIDSSISTPTTPTAAVADPACSFKKDITATPTLESEQSLTGDKERQFSLSDDNNTLILESATADFDPSLVASRCRNLSVASIQTVTTTCSDALDFDDSASIFTLNEPLVVFTAATAVRAGAARAEVINVRRPITQTEGASLFTVPSTSSASSHTTVASTTTGIFTSGLETAPLSTTSLSSAITDVTSPALTMPRKQSHGLSLSSSHTPASLAHLISPGSLKSGATSQHTRNHTLATSTASATMVDSLSLDASRSVVVPPAQLSAKEFDMLPPTIQRKYFSEGERQQFFKAHATGDCHINTSCSESQPTSASQPHSESRSASPHDQFPSPRPTALQVHIPPPSTTLSPALATNLPHTPIKQTTDDDNLTSPSPKIFPTPGKQLSIRKLETNYNISDLVRRRSRANSLNSSFYASLPDKIQRRHLDREEQNIAARHRKKLARAPTLSSTDRLVLDWTHRRPSSNPTPQSVYGEDGFTTSSRGFVRRRRSFDTQLHEDGNVEFDNPFHKQATVLISPSDFGSDSPITYPQTPASATLFPPSPLHKMEHAAPSLRKVPSQSVMSGHRPSLSTPMASLNSSSSAKKENFMESFRWLDEEEDLDLKLHLDDYHQNLRSQIPVGTSKARPSFRRHLSINKMPFSRPVQTGSRPTTKDSVASIQVGPYGPVRHNKRRSRALSLMTPRQTPPIHDQMSPISPIDETAHYSDPNARLKLRLYLASPQKFDEAIQYGFPAAAADPKSPALPLSLDSTLRDTSSLVSPKTKPSRVEFSMDDKLCTFLADDKSSVCSGVEDDMRSSPEFEAPPTPQTPPDKHTEREEHEKKTLNLAASTIKPKFISSEPVSASIASSTNTNMRSPVLIVQGQKSSKPHADFETTLASREMTLRMTLTRPDLRSDDDQIYGWSSQSQAQHPVHVHTRPSSQITSRQSPPVVAGHRKGPSSSVFDSIGSSSVLPGLSNSGNLDRGSPSPVLLGKPNEGDGAQTLDFGLSGSGLLSSPSSPTSITAVGLGLTNNHNGSVDGPCVGIPLSSNNAMNSGSGLSSRDSSFAKESIERQFAAFDLDIEQDRGMMKRIWHRVRRN